MTEREAHELVRAIEQLWHIDMGADGRSTWCAALTHYDSIQAAAAITALSERQRERPTIADVRHMIAKLVRDQRDSRPALEPADRRTLPPWVKRWACARYFYGRFNRQQDLRRFREAGDWSDPSIPLMPDNEWADEASRISDADVMRVFRG